MRSKTVLIVIVTTLISANCTKTYKPENHPEKKDGKEVTAQLPTGQTENLNEKYIYIDNFQDYHNIEDLIKYKDFKNNVLYIDMWGINCGPCIKEFQSLKELKVRYNDKPVKFIYLADGPQKNSNQAIWKDIITKYKIDGYHMPINSDLLKSIMSAKGYKAVGTLPHYILVNKNGEIVNPNAQRPSSQGKLYNQIDKLL